MISLMFRSPINANYATKIRKELDFSATLNHPRFKLMLTAPRQNKKQIGGFDQVHFSYFNNGSTILAAVPNLCILLRTHWNGNKAKHNGNDESTDPPHLLYLHWQITFRRYMVFYNPIYLLGTKYCDDRTNCIPRKVFTSKKLMSFVVVNVVWLHHISTV